MRRYSTGVSSLLSVCALAGVCVSTTADALEPCQPITLVKNIAPGPASSIPDLQVQTPAVRGKTVFFAAKDGTTGLELWRSRGKEGDTALVKDIFPGSKDSEPRFLTVVGDTLFFIADDGAHGAELWKSDGTADGTVLVRDIRPGTEGSGATALTALGNTLFFIADNGVNGLELWKSDGTEAGTELVADLVPGTLGSGLSSLTVMRDTLFFSADGGPQETELWRSDGTKEGTERVAVVRVIESDPGEEIIQGLTAVGDRLYFFAGSAYKKRWDLWKSDGTGPGTVRVTPLALSAADYAMGPDSMTPVGELIYFRAGVDGSLWRSDGTDKGTSLIKPSADARFLTNLNGTLVFTAWDEASGFELWRSDGTVAGTVLVEDIRPGNESSAPSWLTVVDGKVLFSAETTESGRELWSSNGTLEGTEMLQDAVPGPGSLSPSLLTPVGPRVFFLAGDNTSAGASDIGAEPWVLNDCTPPTISCPTEMTAEARSSSGAPVSYPSATGQDNKPEPPVFSYSHAAGDTFPLGPTQIIATATDESGNSAQCSFTVRVRDTQPPSITCPQDHEVWRTTRYGATVDYPRASAIDAVSSPAITYNPPPGSDFIVGITPVIVTATDAAGNTSRCTFRVGVSRQYARGSCGCGASTTSEFAGGVLLSTLALLAGRRRKSGTPRSG